jgi:hypothetical protein
MEAKAGKDVVMANGLQRTAEIQKQGESLHPADQDRAGGRWFKTLWRPNGIESWSGGVDLEQDAERRQYG